MKKHLFTIAFALGLLAVVWVAWSTAGANPLVLVMTAVIAGVFGVGARELQRLRHDHQALSLALHQAPDTLDDPEAWLASLPAALRHAVRQRFEGARGPLPGPTLTPYLVGLLVMLGMLGTFLGMVVTLSGAAFALQGVRDVQGIRQAFAEPIAGLGLAFGASVAGVATSAMLGLMATWVRRERAALAQQIDQALATRWQAWSWPHQRQAAWTAMQAQSQALPDLAQQMQALLAGMAEQHTQWRERLQQLHTQSQQQAQAQLQDLTHRVDEGLQRSLAQHQQLQAQHLDSTQAQLHRLAQSTLQGLSAQAQALQESLLAHSQAQAQAHHTRAEQQQQALTQALAEQVQRWLTHAQDQWQAGWAATHAQHQGQMAQVSTDLTRLIDTAAQAPQAAAEVIAQMREHISASLAQDNALLQERARSLHSLEALLARIEDGAGLVQASAIDVASLAGAFEQAAQALLGTQTALVAQLQQIQTALEGSAQRSDEQLAYCVAQARELIELSVQAQHQVLDALARAPRPALAAQEA